MRLRPSTEAAVTEDEVRIMIAEGAEAGVFHEAEREIVESVFKLGDQLVGALMVPRPLITWLDVEDQPEVNWQIIAERSYSYYPVAQGDLDQFLGVVPSTLLLSKLLAGERPDLQSLLVQPTFVPETMTALHLLEMLRGAHPRVAVVVDEHGVIVGMVTPTDILEAIVGDLPEPGDAADPTAVRRDDGSWLIDGLVMMDDLDELFRVGDLSDAERRAFRTVGGLVMTVLDRMPAPGDTVEWRGLRLEVLDMDGRRVDKVLVTPLGAEEQPVSQ
jgi:putative hemolysin